MVKVFIWSFRGKSEAWGHASVMVGRTYISWWPANPGHVPSKIHRNIYASSPFRNRSYADDVRDEGQPPDHTIVIEGLDEEAIHQWWGGLGLHYKGEDYQGPLLPWSTLDRNCSTVAAAALKAGGGDEYAPWHKAWNLVWTPNDVLQYALAIRSGIGRM